MNRVTLTPNAGGAIRTFAVSLIGAAALAAGLVLLRQTRHQVTSSEVPPGETVPGKIELDRIREAGI